jgi:Listeria/Bacterioides repeat
MSEKTDYENNSAKQDNTKGFVDASESKKQNGKKSRIITYVLIAVLLICIGIGSVFILNSGVGVFLSNAQVTVTFDSTGGSKIKSQTVQKGRKLTEVASPSRQGYVFAGWYYEEAPVNAYGKDDVFTKSTTLYAGWYQPNMKVDKAEYMKDCDSNISFVVHSSVELTEDNLSDYISFSNVGIEDGKTLSVKRQDEGYLLYSKDGFTPGFTYSIQILDTRTVCFVKAGEKDISGSGITSYNFMIYRENENNVVMKAKPKLLSTDDVLSLKEVGKAADGEADNKNDDGKTIYRATLIKKDSDFKAADIISFGSGEEDTKENQYYRVIKVTRNNTGICLDLVTPDMNEIYSKFEVYYSGDAAKFEKDLEDTKELGKDLQTSLKNSKGYDYLCTAIARSIKASPTLLKTVSTLDINSQKRFQELSVSALADLLKNVKFTILFGKTQDLANRDNGCYGKINFTTGDIGIDLADNINLTINLSMSEDITSTAYGWQKLDGTNLYLDNGVYINNTFSMSFSTVIATNSGTINITDEIQKLIDSQSNDKTSLIVDNLNKENLFGDDLDYVEILSKQLGEKTIDIYEVLSIQFTLDFKVSVGIRAGMDLNFSSTELREIGMCNVDYSSGQLETSKMNYYNNRLRTEVHFTAILKGQMGIRAGFAAGVNFSVVHLNKVLNLGFSTELGVYEEISGYLRFDYDYANSSGMSNSSMSLAGGLKSETGIYVELDFTWNIFGYNDSVTIAEKKFPILTIGALEFASEFKEAKSAVTFNTNSYNIKSSGDDNLLNLKYIDISGGANGVTVDVKPAALSGDYALFLMQDRSGKGSKDDLKYVSIDKNTGMIKITDNAPERLDFTVVVQYTKGCSLFSKELTPITKDINFTYMKYKVDDSTKKYKATFYMPDESILEAREYYVGQIPVPPAEDVYEGPLVYTKYRIKDWSKPWKEAFSAIYADTEYHLDYELNYKNITFYGTVYNKDTNKYQYGAIATVPTLVGELPVPPLPEYMDMERGFEFDSWSPSLRAVDADYSYTAVYRQSDDMCWTSFYLDSNHRISADFVKKGTMPEAPDMSQYNTKDRQFVGWWPSLHTSTNNSETYIAVFRQYVNVTFKDRDGKILSEQRILAGTTPEAPKVDDVIGGEEDYYEYHFSHWVSEDGSKPGPVYSDTIYSPVYEKYYLEVTTTFDAGGHTFADGARIKKYNGTYAAYNFLYLPQVTYRDNENTYTVDYWQSTEKVNDSYVKLYMSDVHTDYKYNLTFTPVFKNGDPNVYTVRFDGGDEAIYLTGHYGDLITSDMLTDLKKTSTINNYVYKLSDYGLTLPYCFGSTIGTDGLPAEYINAVAKFELVGVDKTYTFDANGGKFTDNETMKTITAPYATSASFNEVPVKADDDRYTYGFAGWSSDKNATAGSSYSDFIITGDSRLYAVYTKTLRNYTVTFDAGEGYFGGGTEAIEQTYHYGDTIVPPGNPVRDETDVYRYLFTGWQPSLSDGTTVTMNRTYTAAYRAICKDGKMDAAGIIVSNGSSSEDINIGSIPGYTYGFDADYIPTLTITGNGLTFSGTSNEVRIVIASSATEVRFNGLTLSGAYSDTVLSVEETASPLTISISGICVICNIENGNQAVRFERPVRLAGMGAGAKLSISAKGCYGTVYCGNTINVDSLELEIAAQKREGEEDYIVTAIADDGSTGSWLFKGSTIRLNSQGTACGIMSGIQLENSNLTATGEDGATTGNMLVMGASIVDITASGEHAVALKTDELRFADFTGTFSAYSIHSSSPGIAVKALGGIVFEESGTEVDADRYDLGGTQIGSFDDGSYTSFGVSVGGTIEPASTVTVKP